MKRYECPGCFGTGNAGMLTRNTSDLVWRSDSRCPVCKGRWYLGKPSLRRRFYAWPSRPETVRGLE